MKKLLALTSLLVLIGCAQPAIKSTVITTNVPELNVPAPAPLVLDPFNFKVVTDSNKNSNFCIDPNGMSIVNLDYNKMFQYIQDQQTEINAYKQYYSNTKK